MTTKNFELYLAAKPVVASFTVDYHQNLDAEDFLTSLPTGWDISDASSKLSMSTDGEHGFTNFYYPNGDDDSGGVRGMAYSHPGLAAAYVRYAFTAVGTFSYGFWYKSGTVNGQYGTAAISGTRSADGTIRLYVYHNNNNLVNTLYLYGTGVSSSISISQLTWYWITVKYVKAGSSLLRVYDVDGNQVGAEVSAATANYDCTSIRLGQLATFTNTPTGYSYFDDFVLDYTYATFPLGK